MTTIGIDCHADGLHIGHIDERRKASTSEATATRTGFVAAVISLDECDGRRKVTIGGRNLSDAQFAALATAAGQALSSSCRAGDLRSARNPGSDGSPE